MLAVAARTALLPVTVAQVRNTYKMSVSPASCCLLQTWIWVPEALTSPLLQRARPDMLELKDWFTNEQAVSTPARCCSAAA